MKSKTRILMRLGNGRGDAEPRWIGAWKGKGRKGGILMSEW